VLQKVLSFNDLPFAQGAQEGNPFGIVPSVAASGSIGNMSYEAVTPGAAGNSISVTHQLAQFSLPSLPAAPPFTGTLHTVGTGGTFATLGEAITNAAVQNGHRLQLVGASITETALVTINKQVEIFSAENTVVSRSATAAVLQVTVGGVYIHDFTITNGQQASTDAGGQSCCINADTMNRNAYEGVSDIRIENMTFNHPKVGVFVSGTAWVVKDCTFLPNAASTTAGTTLRSMFTYGTVGNCFVVGNTVQTTTDVRVTGIFLDSRNDGIAPNYASGYKGALVVDDNVISNSVNGGAPRSYIDATGFYRQPGLASTNGNLGEFSLYIANNDFSVDHGSSPIIFFGRTGVLPFEFFDDLLVQNNLIGKRVSSTQKGGLYFTSASGLASRSMGTFGGTFYASNNTITAHEVVSPNFSIMAVEPSLLMIRDNTFYDAPSPLLTPSEPVGSFSVSVVGNAVTVGVPPSNPATTLAASLNADGAFSALLTATASDGSNASTTGTVTLSGGVG
jgi:hypothetical protein